MSIRQRLHPMDRESILIRHCADPPFAALGTQPPPEGPERPKSALSEPSGDSGPDVEGSTWNLIPRWVPRSVYARRMAQVRFVQPAGTREKFVPDLPIDFDGVLVRNAAGEQVGTIVSASANGKGQGIEVTAEIDDEFLSKVVEDVVPALSFDPFEGDA